MVAALQYRIYFFCAKYIEVQDTFANQCPEVHMRCNAKVNTKTEVVF